MIDAVERTYENGVSVLCSRFEQKRSHRWRKSQSQYQRAGQGETVGHRHRAKHFALDSLHREQRKKGSYDDGRSEENRSPDFLRGLDCRPPYSKRRKIRIGSMTKDVFDHDHRGVYDDPEIDGT